MKSYLKHLISIWIRMKGQVFLTHYSIRDSVLFNLFMKRKLTKQIIYKDGFQVFSEPAPASVVSYFMEKKNEWFKEPTYKVFAASGELRSEGADNVLIDAPIRNEILSWIQEQSGFIDFGRYYRLYRTTIWCNYGFSFSEESETFSNRYHLDADPQSMIKLFIHLSNVRDYSGPFTFLSLTDSKKLLRGGFRYRESQDGMYIRKIDEIANVITGEIGTSFWAMTGRLIHRAGNPLANENRLMIQLEFRVA